MLFKFTYHLNIYLATITVSLHLNKDCWLLLDHLIIFSFFSY